MYLIDNINVKCRRTTWVSRAFEIIALTAPSVVFDDSHTPPGRVSVRIFDTVSR